MVDSRASRGQAVEAQHDAPRPDHAGPEGAWCYHGQETQRCAVEQEGYDRAVCGKKIRACPHRALLGAAQSGNDSQTFNFVIDVGQVETGSGLYVRSCGLGRAPADRRPQLNYDPTPAAAAEVAAEFGADAADIIISLAFYARPGKEGAFSQSVAADATDLTRPILAFDLGVLSGKFRDLLMMQDQIKFKAIKSTSELSSAALSCAS